MESNNQMPASSASQSSSAVATSPLSPNPSSMPRLTGPNGLLKQSFVFYKKHFNALFLVLALPFIVQIILSLYRYWINVDFIYLILTLASIIFTTLSTISFIVLVSDFSQSKTTATGEAYNKSLGLFWPFVWLAILSALIRFGFALLLIIPSIVIGIYIMYGVFCLIVEEKRGLNALVASWSYIKNYWWATLGRTLYGVICWGIPSLIIGGILISIYHVLTGTPIFPAMSAISVGGGAMVHGDIISGLLAGLVSNLFFLPLFLIYIFKLYSNLKEIKKSTPSDPVVDAKRRTILKVFAFLGPIAGIFFGIIMFSILFAVLASLTNARIRGTMPVNGTNPAPSNSIQVNFPANY
jgi:hypothetical protein